MKKDRNIEQEVEKTLRSLEGIERAQTNDFFYSRLQKRLENKEEGVSRKWNPQLLVAAAAVIVLVLFNILTVLEYQEAYGDAETVRQQNLEAFTEDYLLEIPTIYELTDEE
ncbi:hypothetical protein NC796_10230 [Aliifodinibius sp. S!AR15-10]|uniref:hypothetical protein n=1 Tax=Aliifodinibius sp. S!AR15-10 TaxID=2950437 RepID=UPI002855F038|nr:hypothetical protein [Aliifodinibius sp. S!AR15-10]MDR8391518.1 hypothetical protein [Aliifodinibius sp. S!AR15-10]